MVSWGGHQETAEYILKDVEELVECLDELTDLMEDVKNGEYKPDSFTTQPARIAMAKWNQKYGEQLDENT